MVQKSHFVWAIAAIFWLALSTRLVADASHICETRGFWPHYDRICQLMRRKLESMELLKYSKTSIDDQQVEFSKLLQKLGTSIIKTEQPGRSRRSKRDENEVLKSIEEQIVSHYDLNRVIFLSSDDKGVT